MSATAPTTPPEPVIRFRLRTLLAITTILAIAAAVAASFWKRQTPEAQWALAAYWGALLACLGPVGWLGWREMARRPPEAGSIAFTLKPTSRFWLVNLLSRSRFAEIAYLGLPFATWVIFHSHSMVKNVEHGSLIRSVLLSALFGFLTSFMFCMPIQAIMRKQIYLCENGISLGGGYYVPWKYVRHAQWQPDHPGVMKLHRLVGDIYFDVPDKVRPAVEAFVSSKTRFVANAVQAGAPVS